MEFNLSSSPHIRKGEHTPSIMWDVCIALLPATAFGIYRFGFYSLCVLLISIAFAVLSEFAYQKITKQPVLIGDGSAVLTGLLLGLNMPPAIPLWMPALGSIFAIIFVKQFFGGLGRNFMNPALAGRCFLLISFTKIMSDFSVDGIASSTPLAKLAAGEGVDFAAMVTGFTQGTIGEISAIALLIGGIYLLVKKIISWEIPVCYLASFAVFIFIFGQQAFDPLYVLVHLCGGGIMLGAWFMATDYVTSPITKNGKIVYGILLGVLTGVFRTYGASVEGVSYAIIIGNLLVPLIEKVTMPRAFGLEKVKKESTADAKAETTANASETASDAGAKTDTNEKAKGEGISLKLYHAALKLGCITLLAGLLLGIVYQVTKDPIEKARLAAEAAAYVAVCPQADSFGGAEKIMAEADEQQANGGIAAGKYGNVVIDSAYTALDESGNVNGYVVNVTSKDGYGGEISLSVGFDEYMVITGLEILSISETAGLGMNADTPEFKSQYVGVATNEFVVVKTGSEADNEIDAISGATITSKAVTNAVNAALSIIGNAER